jgi:hypothetical protein
MAVLIVFAVLVGLGLLGLYFGSDSRDGRDWQPYELARGSHPGTAATPVCSGGTAEGT